MATGEPILGAVRRAFQDGSPLASRRAPGDEAPGGDVETQDPSKDPPTGRPAATTRRPLPGPVDLFSADPVRRREALALVARRPVGPRESAALGRVMLRDPEPANRLLAAEALEPAGATVPAAVIDRALDDPDDRVRRAVVALALRRGAGALPLLVDRATDRAWPASQLAVLRALPRLVREGTPIPRDLLDRLLLGLAALDPPPLPEERPALADVARALGVDALRARFSGSERVRAGAARLMILEGSTASLEGVAAMADRGEPEVRALRGIATARLRTLELASAPRTAGPARAPEPAPSPPVGDVDQVLAAMARALADPDAVVRAEARRALASISRPVVEHWVRRAINMDAVEAGSTADPVLACAVAEQVPTPGLAEPLLRAASVAEMEDRGPYLRALSALSDRPRVLIDAVRSLPPAERAGALRVVWRVGGRPVLPALRDLAEDSAAAVRMAVLDVEEEAADPAGPGLAREVLRRDSAPDVRRAALRLLAGTDEVERMDALREALADPDPSVRAAALETLDTSPPSAAFLPLLLAALRDHDEQVWRTAAARLAGTADPELGAVWDAVRDLPGERRDAVVGALDEESPNRLAALAMESLRSEDSEERAMAVTLAARAGTPESAAAVLEALGDPHPAVRRSAAAGVAALRDPSAVRALVRTLTDPKAEVRVEAVRALGGLDDGAVPQVLIDALKDPEVRVREIAADALARRGSAAVAALVAAALASPDLRRPAGAVLERLGPVAIDPLVDVVMGADAEAARAAAALIDRLAGVARFTAALSSTAPGDRLKAVRVLGAIGGGDAADGLLGALTDPDVRVRAAAAVLLGQLGERRAVPALRRVFVSDPVLEVATAAEASLTRLGARPSGADAEAGSGDRPGAWFDISERPAPMIDLEASNQPPAREGAGSEDEAAGRATAGDL